jgi:hypothetical protein
MAKKNVGRLAGLAALGAAAYMMSKGKDATGPAATADEKKSSKARTDAQREAVSGTKKAEAAKDENYSNEGYKKPKITIEPEPAPVSKPKAEVKDLPKADDLPANDNRSLTQDVKGGDPSQSKGVLRSDRDMTQAEAKTILNQTPADKAKQAAQDKKDIASNKADFRAYQRNLDAAKVANLKSKAESQARKADARKASISTDEMKNRSRAQAAYDAKMKRLKANPESQAVESVYPEQYVVAPGAKTVASMAKSLVGRKAAPEYSTPLLSAPPKQLTGPSKADIVARDRAAREAARRDAMLKENANRYGLNPNAPGYEGAAGSLRKNLGGEDFSLGMKRGGAVKMASGGMTASRRGDGIASRGKTRCKMY